MNEISLDYETFYSKEYGINELGTWRYLHDDRFDPYMVAVCDGEETWTGHPNDFNWSALEGARVISHNAYFDHMVYQTMVEKGMAPAVKFHDWVCSANLTSYLCNRRSLAKATEHLLGVQVDKGMRNYMKGKTWEQAIKDNKADKLLEYAQYDAIYCHQLWDKFSPQWPTFEQELSDLTIRQGHHGIHIDKDLLARQIELTQRCVNQLEESLPWVKEGKKVSSPKAIAEECRKQGIPAPPVKSHTDGEEKFAWWEATFGPRYPWVSAVSNWRSMSKHLATLERIKMWLRPDDTVCFSLKYFGGHTGRWSGDAGLNMQNLRKEPIYLDKEYRPVENEEEAAHVLDIRALFIPRKGKKMILSDLSQIEPRVLAWCCGNFDLLEQIAGGMSIYEVHARQSLGWTGGSLKKENKGLYARAKAEVLALGYQAGPVKYVDAAMKMARYKVDPEDAVREVAEFRKRNPSIVALWKQLDAEFKRSTGGTFEMELPSGRSMTYPKVKREYRRFLDEETEKPTKKMVFTADVGGVHKIFYGGKLTENLVQAISRDVFGEHVLKLDKLSGADVLFTVHDEAVLEVDSSCTCTDVQECMSVTPEWLKGCPIAAETVEVEHYQK